MAINYTLVKKLNKVLAGKNVRAANRYLQFYGNLAIFGSVKSWSLKYTYSAHKSWGHILRSYNLKNKMNIKDCF